MAAKNIKICQACKAPFVARRDAKTCSPACRKRLQRWTKAAERAAKEVAREAVQSVAELKAELAHEIRLHEPAVFVDERGSIAVADPPASNTNQLDTSQPAAPPPAEPAQVQIRGVGEPRPVEARLADPLVTPQSTAAVSSAPVTAPSASIAPTETVEATVANAGGVAATQSEADAGVEVPVKVSTGGSEVGTSLAGAPAIGMISSAEPEAAQSLETDHPLTMTLTNASGEEETIIDGRPSTYNDQGTGEAKADNGLESQAASVSSIDKLQTSKWSPFRYTRTAMLITGGSLLLIFILGLLGLGFLATQKGGQTNPAQKIAAYATASLPLNKVVNPDQLHLGQASSLEINGQLKVANTLVLAPGGVPVNPTEGQIYYNQTTHAPYFYNGSQFVSLNPQHVTSVGGASGVIGIGPGLTMTGNQLAVTSVLLSEVNEINNIVNGNVVNSLTGTPNQINVSSKTGNVTLSLPQSIAVSSTPTFAGLTLHGALDITAGGATVAGGATIQGGLAVSSGASIGGAVSLSNLGTGLVQSNGSGLLSSGIVDRNNATYLSGILSVPNGGTGAASFTTDGIIYGNGSGALQATNSSANSVLVTDGIGAPLLSQTLPFAVQDNITHTGELISGSINQGFGTISTVNNITTTALVQAGSLEVDGGSLTVDNSGNVVTQGTIDIQGVGGLTIGVAGSTTGALVLANSSNGHATTIEAASPATQDQTILIPASSVVSDQVCLLTLANCVGTGGGVSESGATQNYIPKFTNAAGSQIGNSLLYDNGTSVGINTAVPSASYLLDVNGNLHAAGSTTFDNTLTVTAGGASITGNFSQSGTGTFSTGTGAVSLNGATTISGGLVVQTGNSTSLGGTLDVTGVATLNNGLSVTSGGANIVGATNINVSGTANTFIGNPTGTFGLTSNGLNVTTGGALSGITGYSQGSGNFVQSGTGTFSTGTGAVSLNGATTVASTLAVQGSGSLTLGKPSANTGSIIFNNATNANTLTLQAGATASNLAFTLPAADGSNGQCLETNGLGVLSFAPCTGGAGGGVTSLDALSGVLTLANSTGSGTTVTIDNAKADGLTKGIATFNSSNFSDNGSGVINIIQDIAPTATPTFGGLTINGRISATSTINGATISGGTLNGGTVSGGTFSGGSVSGGTLTGTSVNGLNVSGGVITSPTITGTVTGSSSPTITGFGTYNGQTISSAANFTGTLTVQGANSLTLGKAGPSGNTGSIIFNNATNANTLTLQAGATSSNLAFTLPTADGSNGQCLETDGTGKLSFQPCTGGAGGGVTSLNSESGIITLQGTTNQVNVTNGSGTITLSTPQDIATTSSPTFSALTLQGAAGLKVGVAGSVTGVITLANSGTASFTTSLQSAAQANNLALSIPADTHASDAICLVSLGNCAGSGSGVTTSGGTANTIAMFTGGQAIGNSILSQDAGATTLTVAGKLAATGTINGATISGGTLSGGTVSGGTLSATAVNSLNVSGTAISGTGALTVDANGANTVSIGGISTGDILLGGGSGSTGCTVTNSNGNFACAGNITTTGTVQGGVINGTSAIELNGTNINTAGTLSNVAYLNQANTFTQPQTVNAISTATAGITAGAAITETVSPTSATSGSYYGSDSKSVYSGTASVTGNIVGAFNIGQQIAGSGVNASNVYGTYGQATVGGAGTVTSLIGTMGQVGIGSGATGNVSNGVGLQALVQNNSTGGAAYTHAYGLDVLTPTASAAGTIATDYGVYINPQAGTGITTAYGLYQAGSSDQNILAGSTRIGSTAAPNYPLDVAGDINVSSGSVYRINGVTVVSGGSLTSSTVNGLSVSSGTITNPTIAGTLTGSGSPTITGFGSISAGAYNGQTISSVANFTGNVTIQGSNALTLGVTGTSTGAILFKGATAASGTLTLIGASNPSTNTLTLPNETGTLCSTGSICAGYAPSTGGNYIAKNVQDTSSASINGYLLGLTNTNTGAAGVLSLTNSGTNSALNVLQSGSSEPGAGQALILANNATATPSGNLLDLQNKGTSELHVDVSGNLTTIGNIQGVNLTTSGTVTFNNTPGTGGTTVLCLDGSNILKVCSGSAGAGNYILNGTTTQTANFNIQSASSSSIGAVIQGASAQTADLQEWRNSSGAVLSLVSSSGAAAFPRVIVGTSSITGAGSLYVQAQTTSAQAAVIRAVTNQTSDLLDVQTTGAANMFSVGATGSALFQNSTDSSTGFQIQNSGGTALLAADTTNLQLNVGNLQSTGTLSIAGPDGGSVLIGAVANSGTGTNAMTFSGNEITDKTRATNTQGDGRAAPDSSTGIWESTTNLVPNGGFESNTSGWGMNDANSSVTRARSTEEAKFGSASYKFVNTNAGEDDFANMTPSVSPSTTYTASAWVNASGFQAAASNNRGLMIACQNSTTFDVTSTATLSAATAGWVRLTTSITTTASDITCQVRIYAPQGTVYWDGVQFEQKPIATPYVDTNGSTATRNFARVQAPNSVLTPSQGWFAARVRPAWSSSQSQWQGGTNPAALMTWSDTNDGTGNNSIKIIQNSAGAWRIQRRGTTTTGTASQNATWSAGDTITIIGYWTSANIYISINGAAFTSVAQTDLPASISQAIDIGTSTDVSTNMGLTAFDGDILWTAAGTGTLSNADAAALNRLGNSDPSVAGINSIDSAAIPSFAWNGEGQAYTGTNNTATLQSGITLDDTSLYHSGNGAIAIQGGVNSTTAFQVQNASGTSDFTVDTTHGQIAVGPAAVPANSVLTVGTNTTGAVGGIYFGTDTNLYRSNPSSLKTDAAFTAGGEIYASGTGSSAAFGANKSAANALFQNFLLSTDTQPAFQINGSGQLNWGAGGSSATDTNLYRSAAGTLTTDGSLVAVGQNGFGVIKNSGSTSNVNVSIDCNNNDTASMLRIGCTGVPSPFTGSTTGTANGIYVNPIDGGSGSLVGVNIQPVATGTLTNLYGVASSVRNAQTGAVTNGYDLYAGSPTIGNGLTNLYGVYIAKQNGTGVTNAYGLYQADSGDANYLAGNTGIGVTPNANYKLAVSSSVTDPTATQEGVNSTLTSTQTTTNNNSIYGVYGAVTLNGSGGNTGIIAGSWGQTTYNNTGTGGNINGGEFLTIQGSSGGGITDARGIYARVDNNSTNAIQNAWGVNVANNNGTGPITNNVGLEVAALSGTSTAYGIQVAAPTGATTKAAINLSDTGGTSAGGLLFGTDTNLYRSANSILNTDGSFEAGSLILAYNGSSNQIALGRTAPSTAGAGITFGSAQDTNLYRSTTSTLKTDGSLAVGSQLTTALSGWFQNGLNTQVKIGSVGSGTAGIELGSSGDTNLYRSTTSTLKTDGSLVVGTLGSGGNTALCSNLGQISTCGTGSGSPFVQGGNSFGTTATLGTNDNNSLAFETNNTTQATIAVGGATTFKNSTDSSTGFQIQNSGGTALLAADTTNLQLNVGNLQSTGTLSIAGPDGGSVLIGAVANSGTGTNAMTFSGNEITDKTRATNTQGDGRAAPDSSTGIWEGTTNLVKNGGFETDASNIGTNNSTSITRDTSRAKFGSASLKFVANGSGTAGIYPIYSSGGNPGTRVPATAGQTYTSSVWIYTTSSISFTPQIEWYDNTNTLISRSSGAAQTVPAGSWTRVSVTAAAPANTVGSTPIMYTTSTPASGTTYWYDGLQFEQKAIATPYVDTDGSAVTRNAAQVQMPTGGLNSSQGWIAARVRMDWASSSAPNSFPAIFNWENDGSNRYSLYWAKSASQWRLDSWSGGTDTAANAPSSSFNSGDYATVVAYWTSSGVAISVNGSAFTVVTGGTRPSLTAAMADIGDIGGANVFDSDILWTAAGTGTLSNADAASLYKLGNSDPSLSGITSIDSSATPAFAWNGESTAYTGTNNTPTLQSGIQLDDVNLYRNTSGGTSALTTDNLLQSAIGVQAPYLDTAGATALGIGQTNATAINIGNTTNNILTTINGTVLVKPTSAHDSATAFQVQNAAGTTNLFTVNSSSSTVNVIGATGTGIFTVKDNATGGTVSLGSDSVGQTHLTLGASGDIDGQSAALQIKASAAATNGLEFFTNNGERAVIDTSGNLTFQQATTVSTSTGNLTVQAAGTGTLALDTAGAGTVNVGHTNAGTINVGNSNTATATTVLGGASKLVVNNTASQFTGAVGINATPSSADTLLVSQSYGTATAGEQDGTRVNTGFSVADTGLKQSLRVNATASNTTGTLSQLVGALVLNSNGGNGGTTANSYNLWLRNDSNTGATVQSAYNVYVNDGTGAGTIQNQYGVYVNQLSKGTVSNYAIYTNGTTQSYFGGALTDAGILNANATGKTAIQIADSGSQNSGLTIGGDTNLYRSTTSTLKTDGSLVVGTLGSGGNTALCSNLGQISTCGTGSGSPFVQGGNSFGTTATLGTNDNNSLAFETNNTTQATIAVGGATTFQNSTDSSTGFQIQNSGGTALLAADTTNLQLNVGNLQSTGTLSIAGPDGGSVLIGAVANSGTGTNAMTFSGNEITDKTRATNTQGDGRAAPDSSTGIWEGTTNLVPNGGFESNTSGWTGSTGSGTASTVTQDTSTSKFGKASAKVVTVGNAASQGIITNGGSGLIGISSSTSYTFSIWAKVPSGGSMTIRIRWYDATPTTISDTQAVVTGTGAWTRYTVSGTSPSNAAKAEVFFMTQTAQAITFWTDGAQLEQKPVATPYVDTNGSTAARSNARVQAPLADTSMTQGWFAARMRMGIDSSVNQNLYIGQPYIDTNNRLAAHVSGSGWALANVSGGTTDSVANLTQSFSTGQIVTAVFAWTSSSLEISLNGGAFTSVSRASVPAGSLTNFDIGSSVGSTQFDGDIFWTAAGTGTLSNADAAALYKLGNSDPSLFGLNTMDSSATPTFAWNGESTTYAGANNVATPQSGITLDDTSIYHSGNGAIAIQGGVNSTTAFQVQNASGTSDFTVDTTNNAVLLPQATSSTAALIFGGDSSANLYKSATATLATDGNLSIGTKLELGCSSAKICASTTLTGAVINETSNNDILDLQNGGSNVVTVTSGGNLTVNPVTSTATTGNIFGSSLQVTAGPTASSTGFYYGSHSISTYNGTASTTGSAVGAFDQGVQNAGSGVNVATVYGTYGQATVQGAGTVGNLAGVNAIATNVAASTGTVTSAIGLRTQVANNSTSGAVFSQGYGVQVLQPTASATGTIGTDYGVYITGQAGTGIGTAYGLYQAGSSDANYLAGKVGIGAATANSAEEFKVTLPSGKGATIAGSSCSNDGTVALFVCNVDTIQKTFIARAISSQTGDLLEAQNSTNSNLFSIGATGAALFQNSTNSPIAFQIQNAATADLFNVDSSTTSNLITNGDLEGAGTAGWAAKGASTLNRVNTQQWQGNGSLQVATTTVAGDGAQYAFTFNPSTQYTLSFYAKVSSGTITDVNIGRQDNGSDIDCLTGQTLTTTWSRFSCTFTTGSTINGSNIYVKKTGSSAETFFIDGVQLQTGGNASAFNAGGAIQIGGVVNSPIAFQNKSDSTSSFQVQSSNGTQILTVDTANQLVGIGPNGVNGSAKLYVATGSFDNIVASQTGSNNLLILKNNSTNVFTVNSTGALLLQPSTDSATALKVSNHLGTATAFDVDTQNTRVGIGTSSPANLLSVGALTTAAGTYQVAVSTGGTTGSGIVVQTVASQSSGYILQAQDSTGATLASIDYQGNLSVKAATINGVLTINGHIITGNSSGSTTTTPGAVLGSTGTCVLNPTNFASGNDTAGTIVLTPDGSGINSGTQCTVNFSRAYSSYPHVIISPADSTSAGIGAYAAATSASGFNIGFPSPGSPSTPYTFNYFVTQ